MLITTRPGAPILIGGLLLLFIAGLVWGPVGGTLAASDRYPPRFWDNNNNGTADDGVVVLRPSGGNWNDTKRNSLSNVASVWRSNTDFDPTYSATSGAVQVFVNGTSQCAMPGQAIAVTCTWITTRSTGSGFIWEDIWDASMSIDTGRSWAWGNVGYGSSPNKYSFRGVLIHETGHVAGLGHESYGCGNPPASKPTMCATADIEDTYQFRTLESSDKYSVDYWY